MANDYEAIVIGGGPNGLAAAVEIARQGHSVLVLEAAATAGGGARTAALTLPGFRHDVCSAIHPLGAGSPFFSSLPLSDLGLQWVHPEIPLAHPLEGRPAAVLRRSVDLTADEFGDDGPSYRRLVSPLVEGWERVAGVVLGPVLRVPRHPVTVARFGLRAVRSTTGLAARFRHAPARALLAGCGAHAIARLDRPMTSAVGLVLLAAGHRIGWPMAKGGSEAIVTALAAHLDRLGGRIETGVRVTSLDDLPPARAVLFATSPSAFARIAADRLPDRYRRALQRFRTGPGSFKVDWALSGPIPWSDPACADAGTLHLGGTLEEITAAEAEVISGSHPEDPFVLFAQQSRFDPTRAPAGHHTAWGYCHVPAGSDVDMTDRIEAQVERFAPGFRDLILERHTMGPADLEAYDANYLGGDIAGGAFSVRQILARPVFRPDPYRAPGGHLYLCSSSTPPGAGVHGMCGHHAALSAIRHSLKDAGG
jgi:phytoene dehydrogenase-like protein